GIDIVNGDVSVCRASVWAVSGDANGIVRP
ncbi:MAG: hypothetical protein ACI9I0_002180, partial [Rhodoferax sp.]